MWGYYYYREGCYFIYVRQEGCVEVNWGYDYLKVFIRELLVRIEFGCW